MDQPYDFIIAGAGAAGLSLVWKILHSPLSNKKILIVDDDLSVKDDKTWCFWDAGEPPFANLVHQKWSRTEVGTSQNRFTQSLDEYSYYCVRKVDFQRKVQETLRSHSNFLLIEDQITGLTSQDDHALLHTNTHTYRADYIFQSCFPPDPHKHQAPQYPLWQHFLGWDISVEQSLFDQRTFTLMDFDESFTDGIAFMYILPWSSNSALVEYTIFSDRIEDQSFYKDKLSLYLNNRFDLRPIDYEINRREGGKIPMQDQKVSPWYKPRILNIGTSGGRTKPSTGYTFQRIQQQTDNIVAGLNKNGFPSPQPASKFRYKAYDMWLLHIIHRHPRQALSVFEDLFTNNSADELFRFLGEETTFGQDLKIMSSVPYAPFVKAIWNSRQRLYEVYKSHKNH